MRRCKDCPTTVWGQQRRCQPCKRKARIAQNVACQRRKRTQEAPPARRLALGDLPASAIDALIVAHLARIQWERRTVA
jgi:hypothetical protein